MTRICIQCLAAQLSPEVSGATAAAAHLPLTVPISGMAAMRQWGRTIWLLQEVVPTRRVWIQNIHQLPQT